MMSERFIDPVKLQSSLAAVQAHAAMGRLMERGALPGFPSGGVISLRQEHARLAAIIDTNKRVMARLDAARDVLARLTASGGKFASLAPVMEPGQARAFLTGFTDALNTAVNGAYLFAGINTDVRPLAGYFETPVPLARQAADGAFLTAFGFLPSDSAAAAIVPSGMQSFLDTLFARQFELPSWRANWSAASSENTRSRISNQELIETSANANEAAFRKLACAYTMAAGLGLETLQPETARTVTAMAARLAGEAVEALTALNARLGATKERVAGACEMMAVQMDLMANHIGVLEAMDSDEVTARVERLREQLQKAYTLTARAQKLGQLKVP